MKPFLAAAAVLAFASAARAQSPQAPERLWQFHPGQTYTWTCETSFTYAIDKNKAGSSGSNTSPELGGGGTTEPPPTGMS